MYLFFVLYTSKKTLIINFTLIYYLKATAEANNLSAVADAKEVYIFEMDSVCGGTKPYMNSENIETEHRRVRDKAICAFNAKKKMGGEEFSQTYRAQLEKVKRFFYFIYLNI